MSFLGIFQSLPKAYHIAISFMYQPNYEWLGGKISKSYVNQKYKSAIFTRESQRDS